MKDYELTEIEKDNIFLRFNLQLDRNLEDKKELLGIQNLLKDNGFDSTVELVHYRGHYGDDEPFDYYQLKCDTTITLSCAEKLIEVFDKSKYNVILGVRFICNRIPDVKLINNSYLELCSVEAEWLE